MIGELARRDGHDEQDHDLTGWLQHDDGSWSVVDEFGTVHPIEGGPGYVELDDAQPALGALGDPVDVMPLSVVVVEVER
ncbi:hypothetical protein [Nocardia arizonensis]|uniref:hypothetical protein n=1 Tax=Nocardia arizonensis TaxID=1141647 RepID=UPI0006D29E70|nr:hypothetical protein [Nocardia arizonensis]